MKQKRESSIGRAHRNQRGQALIEFALVISFMLVPMVVGMSVFTSFLGNYLVLTDAVSIAAQDLAASRGQFGPTTPTPCQKVVTDVGGGGQGAAPYLTTSDFTFALTIAGSNGTSTTPLAPVATFSCGAVAASDMTKGGSVTLTVKYASPYLLTSYGPGYTITASSSEIVQ
jgi:Flp pilus assembly protein TadG